MITPDSPLYLIHGIVSGPDLRRWQGLRSLPDTDQAMHILLTEGFGQDAAPRPYRLHLTAAQRYGEFYGYSPRPAAELKEALQIFANPRQQLALDPDSLESKALPAQWRPGRQLAFALRACPTVRSAGRENSIGPAQYEYDLYRWTLSRLPKGQPAPTRNQVYCQWLERKIADHGGLELQEAHVANYVPITAYRKTNSKPRELPSVSFQGLLTINDSDQFNALLEQGLGRHKAYGFGMLQIRPPGNAW